MRAARSAPRIADYYPNYEHCQEEHASLDSDGQRQLAWYHPGTKIQSFAVAPHVMLDLARTQSPEIQRRYGTNASFLDVSSCVPPSFHTDQRAGTKLAGKLQQTWNAHRELWAFLRTTHQGPMRLGWLIVRDGGTALSWRLPADVQPRSAWQERHVNQQEHEIDFGPLRSAGSISMRRVGSAWHLRTLPRDRPFSLWFDAGHFRALALRAGSGVSQPAIRSER